MSSLPESLSAGTGFQAARWQSTKEASLETERIKAEYRRAELERLMAHKRMAEEIAMANGNAVLQQQRSQVPYERAELDALRRELAAANGHLEIMHSALERCKQQLAESRREAREAELRHAAEMRAVEVRHAAALKATELRSGTSSGRRDASRVAGDVGVEPLWRAGRPRTAQSFLENARREAEAASMHRKEAETAASAAVASWHPAPCEGSCSGASSLADRAQHDANEEGTRAVVKGPQAAPSTSSLPRTRAMPPSPAGVATPSAIPSPFLAPDPFTSVLEEKVATLHAELVRQRRSLDDMVSALRAAVSMPCLVLLWRLSL